MTSLPDICGWDALLPPRTPTNPAAGRIAAKFAVVGAGFTGLAAARRLAELDPGAEIIVIDATTAGNGPAGRNSGFASPRDIPASAAPADIAAARARNRHTEEAFDWLTALAAQHGFAFDLQHTGRIKGAATEAGEQLVRTQLAGLRDLGAPHEFLDPAAMRERTGTGYYRCGLFTHEGHLLQPAALVRGLADSLPPTVRLHENTALRRLRRDRLWHLATDGAELEAGTVILATNAATSRLGHLRDRLVTIHTYAAITEAMSPADAAHLGSLPAWGLLPSHRLGTTIRRVGPDRFMVRSLYAHDHDLPPAHVHATLASCFHRRFPELAHIRLEYVWGGTTALTMNGAPWWGQLDDGLFASAGCNGAGIVKGTILGKRLAERIAGACDTANVTRTWGTASWVAPEPFRSIGFAVVSALERRKAGLEA